MKYRKPLTETEIAEWLKNGQPSLSPLCFQIIRIQPGYDKEGHGWDDSGRADCVVGRTVRAPGASHMSEAAQPVYVSDQVREVERLHRDLLTDAVRRFPIRDQLDRQAHRIAEAHKSGDRAVVTQITCWHPTLVCHSADEIMSSDFTLDDARQTIAREYGFADWSDVEAQGEDPPDQDFEVAVDLLLRGDVEKLRGLLTGDPSLIHRRSSFGHRSTLLHYVGSNGIETYRQRVPMNLAEIARLLIEAGADVNARARMYGGSTVLGLLVTSDHPGKAGVTGEVLKVLEAAGAKRE